MSKLFYITDYKLKFRVLTKINPDWLEYDKDIAQIQLDEHGVIFIGESDNPIDNEYDLECISKMYNECIKE